MVKQTAGNNKVLKRIKTLMNGFFFARAATACNSKLAAGGSMVEANEAAIASVLPSIRPESQAEVRASFLGEESR